ncbi:DsrE family protein [Geopsychrobacter electrodiphilus]|uniref:DsrE family protein n=1 Tax=Geopsychrobacter electrodiphilus TaxID=225196 RepID=UPI0003769EBE|nr:DsrE family protein [Geopsychrobacter electrodiphilus]
MSATNRTNSRMISLLLATACLLLLSSSAWAAGYDNSLKGVGKYDVLFEVSQGNPKVANLVFWAVRNAYQAPEVKALPVPPKVAVVFHGPVVKLLSTNRDPFNSAEWAQVEKFQQTLREMKKDGVHLEVCKYAAKIMGVDNETIIPEIDQVDNGFVSVVGYQMQGYAVVRIP